MLTLVLALAGLVSSSEKSEYPGSLCSMPVAVPAPMLKIPTPRAPSAENTGIAGSCHICCPHWRGLRLGLVLGVVVWQTEIGLRQGQGLGDDLERSGENMYSKSV